MGAQIHDPALVEQFCLGGNSTFTIVAKESQTRFTFKIQAPKDANGFFFVKLLDGPDNWANYQYIGFIRDGEFRHGGAKAKAGADAPSVGAFGWFWRNRNGKALDHMEFWHEGKCAKCARKLTVPESVYTGFGPDCAAMLGIPWVKHVVSSQLALGADLDATSRAVLGGMNESDGYR